MLQPHRYTQLPQGYAHPWSWRVRGQGGVNGAGHTHALDESAKVFHLGPEKQVAKLRIGEENDEEHDSEAQDVLGTASQCGGELRHGFVEADVLEYLESHVEPCD